MVFAAILSVVLLGGSCTTERSDPAGSGTPSPPAGSGSGSPPPATSSPSTSAEPDPDPEPVPDGAVVVDVPNPGEIVAGFASMWVQSGRDVVRVSRQGRVLATIRNVIRPAVDRSLASIAVGVGSVWTLRDDQVLRIDPSTDRVVARVRLPGTGRALAVSDTAVWTVCCSGGIRILRIDPATDAVAASARVGITTAGFATAPGALWWINFSEAASVSRFDTTTWEERYVPTRFYIRLLAVTPAWVWLIGDDRVARVETAGGDPTRTHIRTDEPILSATAAGGTVWLYSGNLLGFDARTGAITHRLGVNGPGGFDPTTAALPVAGVAVLGDRVWTADPAGDLVIGFPH